MIKFIPPKPITAWDKMGFIILECSKTLKQASTELRIKAAHSLERSEAILEKYNKE